MTDSADAPVEMLARPDGAQIAYRAHRGRADRVGVMWLGGFRSDMSGSKAEALHHWAAEDQRSFLRFDYFGHGASSGRFEDATIGRWRADALAALDEVAQGPVVLVGSSMGAWMALLCALARPERVRALVLLAPAVDFTEALLKPRLGADALSAIARDGRVSLPSEFGEPLIITRTLLEEGRTHCLLGRSNIGVDVPVRILQGVCDDDVPPQHAVALLDKLRSEDVELCLIKDGEHRLARPADIARLARMVATICAEADAAGRGG